MGKHLFVAALTTICVMGNGAVGQAAPILYEVTLDTTALMGNLAGPFSLNFQFVDGGGDATNSVTLSNFQFGSGAGAIGSPTLEGGAAGDLSSGVTLSDAGGSFFNAFTQAFDPGAFLRFTILMTTEVEPLGFPDQFSMGILGGDGFGIPTEFADAFFLIDIDSTDPAVQSFASDPASGFSIGAPGITPVPEPASLTLLGTAVLFGLSRRAFTARKKRSLRAPSA